MMNLLKQTFKIFGYFSLLVGLVAGCATTQNKGPESALSASKGNILVIVSSQNEMNLKNGKKYPTGYYFNELTVPSKKLVDAGYELTFADPMGNAPSMDKHSDSADYFGKDVAKYNEYKKFHDEKLVGLKKPLALSEVIAQGLDKYNGVFVPGGHAPMIDLLRDSHVRAVLEHFHKQGKPTALICHGPIALLASLPNAEAYVEALTHGKKAQAKKLAKDWIYSNYHMTIFSTAEEKIAEKGQLGGKVLFYPQDGLKTAGGIVEVATAWQSQAVRDRELITGQNPNSDEKLSELFLAALAEKDKLLK